MLGFLLFNYHWHSQPSESILAVTLLILSLAGMLTHPLGNTMKNVSHPAFLKRSDTQVGQYWLSLLYFIGCLSKQHFQKGQKMNVVITRRVVLWDTTLQLHTLLSTKDLQAHPPWICFVKTGLESLYAHKSEEMYSTENTSFSLNLFNKQIPNSLQLLVYLEINEQSEDLEKALLLNPHPQCRQWFRSCHIKETRRKLHLSEHLWQQAETRTY